MEFVTTLLTWIGYLFAIIGFAATVYKSTQAWFSLRSLNWRDFDKTTKKLIRDIEKDNFYPDVIVSIGRGGAIVGAVISGNLSCTSKLDQHQDKKKCNIPILGTDRVYKWEHGQRIEIANRMVDFSPLLDKKVLLVASDIMSGGTMSFVSDKISESKPADLRTACIVKGITSAFIPDYYGKEIPADFRMPWMYKGHGYTVSDPRSTT